MTDRTDLEDLCALARRGLLSPAELRELERALRTSPSLSTLYTVGRDVDRSTAVRVGDEALITRAADAALARVAKSGLSAPQPPARRRTVAVLLAAAIVCGTGLAAAVWSGAASRWFGAEAPAVVPSAPTVVAAVRNASPVPAAPPEVVTEAPPVAPERPSHFAPSRPAQDTSASALFRTANAARREGDFARARQVYTELIARHPASDEARLARVSLGKLLLAKGSATEAAREFDEYLKGGHGPLTEEALVSRAQSLQKLGKTDGERRTWEALLASHPDSVYAAEAKRRLTALRAPAVP